jgi:stage III sporulation protein AF
MNEFISAFIGSVTAGILLTTIVDLILPDNSTKKYITKICGLILMLLLLSPVIKLLGGDLESALDFASYENSDNAFNLNENKDSYANYFFNEYYSKNQNNN